VRSKPTTSGEAGADLYKALVDAAPDAVVVVDASGVIRIVNRQAETLFGYTHDELVGRSVDMLVPDAVRSIHRTHRERYAAQPQTRPMGTGLNLAARRKNGSTVPVDIALSSIRASDGLLVSAAVRDITARFDLERERRLMSDALHDARLRQAQRLETVGQLAGGIAHDLNNLLAVILNYADFLAEQLPEGEMRRDVEEIQRAASRAADLSRQLLLFARSEVTKPELLDAERRADVG